jgi:hypothetical protein
MNKQISGGLFHDLPIDLRQALSNSPKALLAWEDISAIARNEWICWVITVKQEKTRKEHINRTCTQLAEGKRRPCCWVGCLHRTDKALSPWAQKVLKEKQSKTK